MEKGVGLLEPVPPQLVRFLNDAVLMARFVNKICRDKEGKRNRVLVIANYGLCICHVGGHVNRFAVFSTITHFMVCNTFIAIRAVGQPDILLELAYFPTNASNDPLVVVNLIDEMIQGASSSYRRIERFEVYSEMLLRVNLSIVEQNIGENDFIAESAHALMQLKGARYIERRTDLAKKLSSRKKKEGSKLSVAEIRQQVVELYGVHNPVKLCHVDTLLEEFRGREEMLLRGIKFKYENVRFESSKDVALEDTEDSFCGLMTKSEGQFGSGAPTEPSAVVESFVLGPLTPIAADASLVSMTSGSPHSSEKLQRSSVKVRSYSPYVAKPIEDPCPSWHVDVGLSQRGSVAFLTSVAVSDGFVADVSQLSAQRDEDMYAVEVQCRPCQERSDEVNVWYSVPVDEWNALTDRYNQSIF